MGIEKKDKGGKIIFKVQKGGYLWTKKKSETWD